MFPRCASLNNLKLKSCPILQGFFCKTESELDELARVLDHERKSVAPMFEVCIERPSHWPPPNTGNPHGTNTGKIAHCCVTDMEPYQNKTNKKLLNAEIA